VSYVLASIPSPHTGIFHILGRPIHLYGLLLLLAIVACIWLTWVRWKRWGGDPDLDRIPAQKRLLLSGDPDPHALAG
jgi:prolipoprotein diacylglyceryltransferase